MATHNINKITVPNGDVYNLLDSGRSDFVTKSGLLTSIGTSTNNTMTQAAITNAVTNATPYIITWNYGDEDGPTVNISEVTEAISNNRLILLIALDSTDSNNTVYRLVEYGSESYGLSSLAFSTSIAINGYQGVEGWLWTRTSSTSTGEWSEYTARIGYIGDSPITITSNHISHAASGVTAQTTQALYPFTVNATGHITGVGSAITSMTPTSHTHGNITNAGDITTNAAIASGDRLVINDESASKLTNSSITFGTSTTQFLANNGTWQTPSGDVNQNAFSNIKVGNSTISADTTTDTVELVAGTGISLTADTTNDKVTITSTVVGEVTDVQVNGTSVLSSGVANIVTNSAYNSSTNKIATMSDIPSVTSTYSSTGTTAVTGTAVNSALQTLDSSISATTGQAISAITITDGKISGSSKISVGEANLVTDVQVNGTSILSSKVANFVTNTAYNSSTNKIATMSDLPSITSSYSSTGTTAVNGTAVNAALQTLDSSISATTNQAISAVTITDGKISGSSKISVPNITSGTADPTGGSNGDIYIQYTA